MDDTEDDPIIIDGEIEGEVVEVNFTEFQEGMKKFQDAIPGLVQAVQDTFANITKNMNRWLGDISKAIVRAHIERTTGISMTRQAIEKRRDSVMAGKVLAKRKGPSGKKPSFICPKHKGVLIFSQINQLWECPEPGCYQTRLPEIDRKEANVVKSPPKFIGRQDDDGDLHWYMNFPDEGILIELKFDSTSEWVAGKGVIVGIEAKNYDLYDKDNNKISLSDLVGSGADVRDSA